MSICIHFYAHMLFCWLAWLAYSCSLCFQTETHQWARIQYTKWHPSLCFPDPFFPKNLPMAFCFSLKCTPCCWPQLRISSTEVQAYVIEEEMFPNMSWTTNDLASSLIFLINKDQASRADLGGNLSTAEKKCVCAWDFLFHWDMWWMC